MAPLTAGRGRSPRSPYFDAFQKLAPYLFLVLFAVIAAALVINGIQGWIHPESKGRDFDATQNISRINSKGMIEAVLGKRAARRSQDGQSI